MPFNFSLFRSKKSISIGNLQLQQLEDTFKQVWRFIKKIRHQNQPLKNISWHLVLGPSNSGKTSLITNAELNFLETPGFATHPTNESLQNKRFNWWLTPETLVLDIPGQLLVNHHYFVTRQTDWQKLIQLLRKYQRRNTLAGIIITLDPIQWMEQHQNERQNYIHNLKALLYPLIKAAKNNCPIYLMLCKLDQFTGFKEFFSDLGEGERAQPWGISFSENNQHYAQSFKPLFDKLIKQLHDRVIWRLHQERNEHKRLLIQNFPLQVESIKQTLSDFIYQLSDIISFGENNSLKGIYLTSSLTGPLNIDLVEKSIAPALQLKLEKKQTVLNAPSKPYFTTQIIKKIFSSTPPKKRFSFSLITREYSSTWGYVLAAGLILSCGSWMAFDFAVAINNTSVAEKKLAEYSVLSQQLSANASQDLTKILPVLNDLQAANALLENSHSPWLIIQNLHQHHLETSLQKAYHDSLVRYFLPNIATLLQQPLANTNNPDLTYGALKTYLMLGDPSHLDTQYISSWLTTYWERVLPKNIALQQELSQHLSALLSEPFSPITLNQQSVVAARNILMSLDPSHLAYVILKNNNSQTQTLLFPSTKTEKIAFESIFVNAPDLSVSSFYTANEFVSVFSHGIDMAANEAINGNWVLDNTSNHTNSESLLDTVIQKTQSLYLQDYASHWQALLSHLNLIPWKNWDQANNALSLLSGKNSPLLTLNKLLIENTSIQYLAPATARFSDEEISLIKSNLAITLKNNNDISTTSDRELNSLVNLQQYLQPLITHNDDQMAFELAKNRFADNSPNALDNVLQVAQNAPLSLQPLLTAIAQNTWNLISTEAIHYLNDTWQTQIIVPYNTSILNRYPIFKSASDEITPNNFTRFFGRHGVVENYVLNYLAPFIITNKAQWQLRQLNGQSLSLPNIVLSQLERASIIRSMFFDNTGKLQVPFSLQLISTEPSVQQFTLSINGKTILDSEQRVKPYPLIWPNTQGIQTIKMSFTNDAQQTFTDVEKSSWGLFRLLDKANLEATPNPQTFALTLDLDGNAARAQLLAYNVINPFIPHVVDQFRLPVSLGG